MTFTPVLVVYLLFVDSQSILDRVRPRSWKPLVRLPSALLVGTVLAMAIGFGISWNIATMSRDIFNLGGTVNWRSIWYPVLPLALFFLLKELAQVVQIVWSRLINNQIVERHWSERRGNTR